MSREEIDQSRRRFLVNATSAIGGVGAAAVAVPFISSWFPSAKAQAAGVTVEANISKLKPGQQITIEWRGKPVWIIRRTQEMIDGLESHENKLRDPMSKVAQQPTYAQNRTRSINPDYLVLVGICTHLGCSPKFRPEIGELEKGWPGGFYCPCHGSKFDMSGRVYQGVPAPVNLQVPPYKFADQNTIIIGEDYKQV